MNTAHNPKPRKDGDTQEPHDADRVGGITGGAGEVLGIGPQNPIDWKSLRSRLFAAREFQASLDPEGSPESLRLRLRGSFDGCAASVLTAYQGVTRTSSKSVNLDASSYGKPADGNVPPVADVTINGGRGQR